MRKHLFDLLILALLLSGMLASIRPAESAIVTGILLAGGVIMCVVPLLRKDLATSMVLIGVMVIFKVFDILDSNSLGTILLFAGLGLLTLQVSLRLFASETEADVKRQVFVQHGLVCLCMAAVLAGGAAAVYYAAVDQDLNREHGLTVPLPAGQEQQTSEPVSDKPQAEEPGKREETMPVDPQEGESGIAVRQEKLPKDRNVRPWMFLGAALLMMLAAAAASDYRRKLVLPRRRLAALRRQAEEAQGEAARDETAASAWLALLLYQVSLSGVEIIEGKQLYSELLPVVATKVSMQAEEAYYRVLTIWQDTVYGGQTLSEADLKEIEDALQQCAAEQYRAAGVLPRMRLWLLGIRKRQDATV